MIEEKRLILSTKKSLYDPFEIEIDGQVYQNIVITRTVLREINKLEDEIREAEDNTESIYKYVQILFNVDLKILEKLDKRDVQDIYSFAKKKFWEIEEQRAKLITETFANLSLVPEEEGKEKPEKKIPSQKRPGNKQ